METDRNQIEKAIKESLSHRKEISAVYLFGSHARNQQHPYSDIDLGILFHSPGNSEIANHLEEIIPSISRALRKDIDVVVMNSASERLLGQIFTKGHCVLVNNPRHLACFKMTAFSKIADFEYYKTQFQKSFTNKILQADHGNNMTSMT